MVTKNQKLVRMVANQTIQVVVQNTVKQECGLFQQEQLYNALI